MIETDLRFTEDGEVVIMHDDTLDRTTNCSGQVSKWKLADILAKCDAGSWLDPKKFAGQKVPTVYDLMRFLASSGMSVVLDLKVKGLMSSIAAAANATQGVDPSQLCEPTPRGRKDVRPGSPLDHQLNPNINSPIPSSIKGADGGFGDLREMGSMLFGL